jgi:hypothetical protein
LAHGPESAAPKANVVKHAPKAASAKSVRGPRVNIVNNVRATIFCFITSPKNLDLSWGNEAEDRGAGNQNALEIVLRFQAHGHHPFEKLKTLWCVRTFDIVTIYVSKTTVTKTTDRDLR